MLESSLIPRFGIERRAMPGRYGAKKGDAGVRITLRTDLALASVIAWVGQQKALSRRVYEEFGLELPGFSRRSNSGPVALVWAGPTTWLAIREGRDIHAFGQELRGKLAGIASVTDQSDGRIVFRVSGSRVRETLAKGVAIDLHPRAFSTSDAAVTSVAHIGVHIWQIDDMPTYEIAVFRSFAGSFWDWLVESSAEFGAAVEI